jgi:nicotinate-nucleotide adenylyltransferase
VERLNRLGVFGGTFDPPHLGHLILADEARFQLNLSRVLWVLTPEPPHKEGIMISPWRLRLELLTAAIGGEDHFELSDIDLNRAPPHFAFETLRILRSQNPEATLIYLMGGDSLHDLPTWERPLDFLEACDAVGVMRRIGDNIDLPSLEAKLPGISTKVCFVNSPIVEISGSEIRRRAAIDEPIKYFLPSKVYQLIVDMQLYKMKLEKSVKD